MSAIELRNNLIQRVNVGDLLTRNAASRPGHEAVVDGPRRFTNLAFNRIVNRLAHGFLSKGCKPGDTLAILSRNNAEFFAIYLACAKIGLVCVPVNILWKRAELAYVLQHAGVGTVVLQAEFLPQLEAIRPQLEALRNVLLLTAITAADPDQGEGGLPTLRQLIEGATEAEPEVIVRGDDPLSYLYTSGTTSAPKAVVSSHLSIYLGALSLALDAGITPADRALAMLPLFHTSPLNSLCTPALAAGATIHIRAGFDAEAVLDLFEAEGISMLLALPIMYRAMMEAQARRPRKITGMRLALYGMAPMPVHELSRAMEVFNCEFALIFGQTEMAPVTSLFRPEHQLTHPGAAGTPSTNVQIGIMDGEGRMLPRGQSGEIVYRSPQTLSCYLHDPEATDTAFRHGWFHSGDVGYLDDDGLLWFKDRLKDVIKTGGENVASVEVEQALYDTDPDILEVVAIGLPHAYWGEAVTAIAIARDGRRIDGEALLSNLRARLSPYKCPKAIIVVDALPKTATGKVQKDVLRKRYIDHYAGAGSEG